MKKEETMLTSEERDEGARIQTTESERDKGGFHQKLIDNRTS
jgi:hypothetical protein